MVGCPYMDTHAGNCWEACADAVNRGEWRICVGHYPRKEEFVRCEECAFARPSRRVDWGTAWVRCSKSGQEMPMQYSGCTAGKKEVA